MANLSCSKACDTRGRLGDEPNEDIAYCDSAMIPWLVSVIGKLLSELAKACMATYLCSGRISYKVVTTNGISLGLPRLRKV